MPNAVSDMMDAPAGDVRPGVDEAQTPSRADPARDRVMPQPPSPSLNAMRAFEAVARLGSVSVAAAELSVTPGAISRQIKSLEKDLGVVLLERDGRGVRLTATGEHLRNGLETAFAQIARTVDRTRRRLLRDTVRIVSPPLFAMAWLVPRIDRFEALAPETDVVVHEKSPDADAPALDADLIIEWGSFSGGTNGIAEKLGDEEIFPVCSPRIRTNGSLAGAPLLHHEDPLRPWHWPDWPTFLTAAGIRGIDDATKGPRFSGGSILGAVREGKGVALTCTSIARDDLAAGRLVRPVAECMTTGNGYWLLTPEHKFDRPEIAAFRTRLLSRCYNSPPRGARPNARSGPRPLSRRARNHECC